MEKQKVCCIVVGHSSKKQGASNPDCGMTEYNFNSLVARSIAHKASRYNIEWAPVKIHIVYRQNGYAMLSVEINEIDPDFIVSLHCNAFNQEAVGKEVLYSGSAQGKLLAECIHGSLSSVNDRGIKARELKSRGGELLHRTKAPCVIAEPFFIDSPEYFGVDVCRLVDEYWDGICKAARIL